MANRAENDVVLLLRSPFGGDKLEFVLKGASLDRATSDEVQNHFYIICTLVMAIQMQFKNYLRRRYDVVHWKNASLVRQHVDFLNSVIAEKQHTASVLADKQKEKIADVCYASAPKSKMANRAENEVILTVHWKNASLVRQHVEFLNSVIAEKQYMVSDLTDEQKVKIADVCYARAIKNPEKLEKCYKSFSPEIFGEMCYEQIQHILNQLNMDESDVFVDLGSGCGNVVTYVAGFSKVKKVVGIEKNYLSVEYAVKMEEEFKSSGMLLLSGGLMQCIGDIIKGRKCRVRIMRFSGQEHQPFELHHGSFLDDQFYELITKEATVIFTNNFCFYGLLMMKIREFIPRMSNGTRIICTEKMAVTRDETKMP